MIAGIYQGGNIPEELQQLIQEVYRSFIPDYFEYVIDREVMLEWYRMEYPESPLKAGLWLPII